MHAKAATDARPPAVRLHRAPTRWQRRCGSSSRNRSLQASKRSTASSRPFASEKELRPQRPAGIARYDYLKENYTELLWVAEGLTSYYDNLLPTRAGVISVEDYRERLAENVDSVVDRPGYGRDSLAIHFTWKPDWESVIRTPKSRLIISLMNLLPR